MKEGIDDNSAEACGSAGLYERGTPHAGAHGEVGRDRILAVPDEMIQVVLTIDTEPDDIWTDHLNRSVANVQELLPLQERLSKYGAKATFLVTYRVVKDDHAAEVLDNIVRTDDAEVGAHLHPWETPPFLESGIDRRFHTYPHELSKDVFRRKLTRLTEAIADRFGHPTSYRGGRWGISSEHFEVLEQLGFEVDTTITPLLDWRNHFGIPASLNGCGGVDFRGAPRSPYHPDHMDMSRKGDSTILEVPLTVALSRRTPAFVRRAYNGLPIMAHRVLRKLRIIRPVWATPAEETEENLERMLRVALTEELPIINISIHSSELMVGGSPLSQTERDVERILSRFESILSILASDDRCVFSTLTQAARWWKTLEASRKPIANSDGTRTLGPGA